MSGGDSLKVRSPNPVVVTLDTPQFHAIFTEELVKLTEIFSRTPFEIRLAGGPVRDLLTNKVPEDIDIATTATPTEMKEVFTREQVRMVNTNGEKHGTVTARINDKSNFEITTLRIDEETDGRHAKVVFTTDWQQDAYRRDLTINSMFMDFSGNVYDFYFGYEDLKSKRVAFVGNASDRIREDYLRILRYFRFYGRVSEEPSKHEPETIQAIKDNIQGLGQISGERIWTELKKTLQGNFSTELVALFIDCGASQFIGLPDNPNVKEFNRVSQYKNLQNPIHPITRLVAFLATQDDALKLHDRLKFSAFERDLAFFLVQNRTELKKPTNSLTFKKMCFKSSAPVATIKLFVMELLKYGQLDGLVQEILNWEPPVFSINGKALKTLNCPEGKVMGHVKQQLMEAWMESDFTMDLDKLMDMAPGIIETSKDVIASKPNITKNKNKRKLNN